MHAPIPCLTHNDTGQEAKSTPSTSTGALDLSSVARKTWIARGWQACRIDTLHHALFSFYMADLVLFSDKVIGVNRPVLAPIPASIFKWLLCVPHGAHRVSLQHASCTVNSPRFAVWLMHNRHVSMTCWGCPVPVPVPQEQRRRAKINRVGRVPRSEVHSPHHRSHDFNVMLLPSKWVDRRAPLTKPLCSAESVRRFGFVPGDVVRAEWITIVC